MAQIEVAQVSNGKIFDEGPLVRWAVLAAMSATAWVAPAAMAQAITTIEGDLEVTGDAQVDGDLQVGTATTTTETETTEGAAGEGILPYIVDNGDGTSTVYTVTATNASNTTTTTTVTTGDVRISANGDITTVKGSTTATTATSIFDIATEVLIDNETGLPIGAAIEGVVGRYDPTTGVFVAGVSDPVINETTQMGEGGNLTIAGTGSFGGNVVMNGNRVTGMADGVAATDAATVGQVAANDALLQSAINAEAATRAAADLTLQANIDAEAALRLAGDARLDQRVDTVEKGVALAMAIAAVPTVDYGRFSLGVGLGNFKGETAGAVGLGFKVGERAKFSVNFASDGDENGGSIGFAVGY
jgi:hypothetical protein